MKPWSLTLLDGKMAMRPIADRFSYSRIVDGESVLIPVNQQMITHSRLTVEKGGRNIIPKGAKLVILKGSS